MCANEGNLGGPPKNYKIVPTLKMLPCLMRPLGPLCVHCVSTLALAASPQTPNTKPGG